MATESFNVGDVVVATNTFTLKGIISGEYYYVYSIGDKFLKSLPTSCETEQFYIRVTKNQHDTKDGILDQNFRLASPQERIKFFTLNLSLHPKYEPWHAAYLLNRRYRENDEVIQKDDLILLKCKGGIKSELAHGYIGKKASECLGAKLCSKENPYNPEKPTPIIPALKEIITNLGFYKTFDGCKVDITRIDGNFAFGFDINGNPGIWPLDGTVKYSHRYYDKAKIIGKWIEPLKEKTATIYLCENLETKALFLHAGSRHSNKFRVLAQQVVTIKEAPDKPCST